MITASGPCPLAQKDNAMSRYAALASLFAATAYHGSSAPRPAPADKPSVQ
jgi:hypothetical protein